MTLQARRLRRDAAVHQARENAPLQQDVMGQQRFMPMEILFFGMSDP